MLSAIADYNLIEISDICYKINKYKILHISIKNIFQIRFAETVTSNLFYNL